ncbi:MAG: nucleoside deaminase [Clostridia bacterium]|nr:nucleoside deaminase [Clostridia bacterium]
MNEIMKKAFNRAKKTMNENYGGPFGAAVVNADGEVLSVASNTVLKDHNPTAHGEINAIIKACKKIQSEDLSGCTLYTTAYPCPMCLGAIIWANIDKVYYGCTAQDAEDIGFRDDYIYDFIKGKMKDKAVMDLKQIDREECLKLFEEYKKKGKEIY